MTSESVRVQYHDPESGEMLPATVHSFKLLIDGGGLRTVTGREFPRIHSNGDEAPAPTTAPGRPIYAKRDGSQWVGTGFDLEPVTDAFSTLKALRQEYGASTSKGVGERDGQKVYQLIYPLGGDDE